MEIPELKHQHKDPLDSIMRLNHHMYNFRQKKLIEPHFNELPEESVKSEEPKSPKELSIIIEETPTPK